MGTASQTIVHLLDFLLDFNTPFFFLLSLSLRLSLLSSISELAMLSGSLLLSLPPVLSWSTTPLEENICQTFLHILLTLKIFVLSVNNISHPVTAAMLVMEDLLNSLSFSLNFRFLLSVPMLAFVAVRYRSHPRMMFLGFKSV